MTLFGDETPASGPPGPPAPGERPERGRYDTKSRGDAARLAAETPPGALCVCGHPASDHASPNTECLHAWAPGVFCSCSLFRPEAAPGR